MVPNEADFAATLVKTAPGTKGADPSVTAQGSQAVVLTILRAEMPRLRTLYQVRSLVLFGSVARGDDRPESDVDFIVEFNGQTSHQLYFLLKADLERLLGRRVDLGTPKMIRPSYRDAVARESIRVA